MGRIAFGIINDSIYQVEYELIGESGIIVPCTAENVSKHKITVESEIPEEMGEKAFY